MAAKLKKYLKGFTLIELIIVIAIIAVLGATAFLLLTQWMSKGRDASKLSSIRTIKTALEINFTSKGDYPIPEDAVEHTGANGITLYQGYVGANMIPELQKAPIDPSTKKPYVYSYMKLNGGQGYYQIGTTMENTVGYEGYNLAKADISTTAKVVGNYEFDPSLPSLIIAGGNESTRGIYDPSTCFVIDGGKNTVDGAQCQPKKDMSLKDFDKGLVGYWPFEEEGFVVDNHLHGGSNFFKDYSGNENHAFNSGAIQGVGFVSPVLSGGYMGKGLYFTSGSLILGSDLEFNFKDSFTLSSISKIYEYTKGPYPLLFNSRYFGVDYAGCNYFPTIGMCPVRISQNTAINSIGFSVVTRNEINGSATSFNDALYRKNNLIVLGDYYKLDFTFEKDTLTVYINGIKNRIVKNEGFIFSQYLTGNIQQTAITIGGIRSTSPSEIRDFHGIIDEVKIYNRALSDAEILQQAKSAGF